MIRVLAIIAVVGFLMSAVCISVAVAIGAPEAIARGAWWWEWAGPYDERWMGPADRRIGGPTRTRDQPWTGGATLDIAAPADIDYIQAPGPGTLTITGPARVVDQLKIEGGRISPGEGGQPWRRVRIVLRAPAVSHFELRGANRLSIRDYRQDELRVAVTGHANVSAQGETKTVSLRITGAGDADLAALKTLGADIEIAGAGEATLAPSEWAKVRISGAGDVELLTRPQRLHTEISGAGRVRQPEAGVTKPDGGTPAWRT